MKQILAAMVLAAGLVCGGCTSVPLGTMLKLRGFSEADFAAMDPNAIRMEVWLNDPLAVEASRTRLEVTFVFADREPKVYSFGMEEAQVRTETTGWIRTQNWNVSTLEIGPEGKRDLARLQKELGGNMKSKSEVKIQAAAGFKGRLGDAMPEAATVRIRLQLYEADGFFTLIDETEVELKREGQGEGTN